MDNQTKKTDTRSLALAALFTAVIAVLGATPLGIVPIGPIGLTTVHIPVIVGSLMLGAGYGTFFGFVFGTVSLLVATFAPFIGAFVFSPFAPGLEGYSGNPLALVVCYLPRLLIGVFTPLAFRAFVKLFQNRTLAYGCAALVGTLTNTVLVLSFIYLFFGRAYAEAVSIAHSALLGIILGTIVTQGLPEAAAAIFVAMALGKVVDMVQKQRGVS